MRLNSIFIVLSFASLLVSFWNRNALPRNVDYVPAINEEPAQTPTRKSPFAVNFNGIEYLVEARVVDEAGNFGTISRSTFVWDVGAPVSNVNDPETVSTVRTLTQVTGTTWDPGNTSDVQTVEVSIWSFSESQWYFRDDNLFNGGSDFNSPTWNTD